MKQIHFIVNPISGKGKHVINQELIDRFFPKEAYKVVLHFSAYKKHAIALTQEAMKQRPDIIVACGGDGTIHEVAAQLVNTDIALGIIPVGSGNGLASNLEISKSMDQAMENVKNGLIKHIDVGQINHKYFFSNMGFGIDATIIENYEKSGSRKLISYLKAAIQSAKKFEFKNMEMTINGVPKRVKPLLLFISNSNEMGYSMTLTPKASLQDGLLDILMVPKINTLQKFYFGLLVLLKKTDRFAPAEWMQLPRLEVTISDFQNNAIQLDGEYYLFKENTFVIQVLPSALKVLC
ncbi:diacylglycerol/lipid kinase family protein [Flavobacterium sp. JP2137]|uniref:diacylglycerol/lipid kinase family protein n=1 Tax=Flavobacterium sp. JP2137 TaxID=3414510 RepID=UPI003D2FE2EF